MLDDTWKLNSDANEQKLRLQTVRTFSNKSIFARPSQSAVDFTDQFHVVQERVEGIEVGEAYHVRGAATGCLRGHIYLKLL